MTSEQFRTLFKTEFHVTLDSQELGFYACVFEDFDQMTIQTSIDDYINENTNNRFLKPIRPLELKRRCEVKKDEKVLESMELTDCRFCNNSGTQFLLWGGNVSGVKHNWKTGQNPEGMRIIKPEDATKWNYIRDSECPCTCNHGKKIIIARKCSESIKVIQTLREHGFLQKRPFITLQN